MSNLALHTSGVGSLSRTAKLFVKEALSQRQLDAQKLGPKTRDPQIKGPTRPSCAPTKAYNPIRFTLPNALTCLSAGQLGSYLSNSLRTIQGIGWI